MTVVETALKNSMTNVSLLFSSEEESFEFNHFKKHSPDLFNQLLEAIEKADDDDFLLVQKAEDDEMWLVFANNNIGNYHIETRKIRIPNWPSTEYLSSKGDIQRQQLETVYRTFREWTGFSQLFSPKEPVTGSLFVWVGDGLLDFLRFPLTAFFETWVVSNKRYRRVEWIVTQKPICQSVEERNDVKQTLCNPQKLLSGAVVILNTYSHLGEEPLSRLGTFLVLKVFYLLKDIPFFDSIAGMELHTLRWYVNPSLDVLESILKDTENRLVFADFHTRKGTWTLEDGTQSSWLSPKYYANEYECNELWPFCAPDSRTIETPGCGLDLSHVQLMCVYHCKALFGKTDELPPANEHSIVGALFKQGARRVEGGFTEDSYIHYLLALLEIFYYPHKYFLDLSMSLNGSSIDDLDKQIASFVKACSDQTTKYQMLNEQIIKGV